MKYIITLATSLCILFISPSTKSQNLYTDQWYTGEWMSSIENFDGQKFDVGIKITSSSFIKGCILPKSGNRTKFEGKITNRGSTKLEATLSNGKEIQIYKKGIHPNNDIKVYYNDRKNTTIMERSFLPEHCV